MIPLTHLTVWYNYTIEHAAVDDVEHLVFLGLGLPLLAADLR